jgi:hypothetical protein
MSVPQRSFAGGEIAPALYARTDQVKYATGLRACRNLLIRRHGGATLRSGTKFIQESKLSSDECLLRRFVRDATSIADTFLLEFGDGYLRFYQDGGAVVTSGVSAWANTTAYAVGDLVTRTGVTYYCISAHTSATATDAPGTGSAWQTRWYAQTGTIYEIPTPYATADLPTCSCSRRATSSRSRTRRTRRASSSATRATRWILTTVEFGPSIAAPTNVSATGGAPARSATGPSRRSRRSRSRNRSRASTAVDRSRPVGRHADGARLVAGRRRDLVQRLSLDGRADVRSDQLRRRLAARQERQHLGRLDETANASTIGTWTRPRASSGTRASRRSPTRRTTATTPSG